MAINYNPSIVRDGLVLYLDAANPKSYPGSGTLWKDIQGSNDGTVVSAVTYSTDGKGSFVFDGTDEYVNGSLASLTAGSSSTIEAVIRINNVTGTKAIFSHGRSGVSFNSGMVIVGANLRFRNSNNDHALSSPTTLATSQWYHLVLSTAGTTTTGYCNAVSQGTVAQGLTNNSINDYHVGRRSSNVAGEFMNGSIAFVRVYQNRALTATEVQQNFNALRGRYGI